MIDLKNLSKGVIKIQTHDNPDADALASAYAVFRFLKHFKKESEIVYYGREITKPNLILFRDYLNFDYKTNPEVKEVDTLITVDSQYALSNVTKVKSNTVISIDHHQQNTEMKNVSYDIRNKVSSCSTIIFDYYILDEVPLDSKIATGLYYGLLTDSLNFTERMSEEDYRMKEWVERSGLLDTDLINRLKKEVLSIQDAKIVQRALASISCDSNLNGVAIIQVEQCDQNILGYISDLVLDISGIQISLVFYEGDEGYRLSVRSVESRLTAYSIIQSLTGRIGDGGGHLQKAGGFIDKKLFKTLFKEDTIISYINRILLKALV